MQMVQWTSMSFGGGFAEHAPALHELQLPHCSNVQSLEHFLSLQGSVSSVCLAHLLAAQPFEMLRERVRVPSPHGTEQLPQFDQFVTVHSLSQLLPPWGTLHGRERIRDGHVRPPCAACTSTPRRVTWMPLHSLEQGADCQLLQLLTAQCTGQGRMSHASVSKYADSGHSTPPNAALVSWLRRRVRVPPPHVALQSSHGCHACSVQSIGHLPELHTTVSRSAPTHFLPAPVACRCTLRERDLVPPPHVRVH